MKLILPSLLFSLAAISAAQDTGSTSVAVIKGKAPVAKKLLLVRLPKPKIFTLRNGLQVYVLEDHKLPAVRLSLQLRAGSINDVKPGVAELTASLLGEGTTAHDYLQWTDYLEGYGISVNAGSGLDMATVSASGLSENTDLVIDALAEELLRPAFPNERLDYLKFQLKAGARQRRSNPATAISELTSKVFYGGTKFARVPVTPEEAALVTVDDIKQFYQSYYIPNGAILGVTGDVNYRSLKSKLEKAFGSWTAAPSATSLPTAASASRETPTIYLIDRPHSAQTSLQFGVLGVAQNDPDYIPLVVANRILGGGSSGRLFQNIRERKGYTYGAYSTLGASRWPAVWGANANVRTAVTEPAIHEFFFEFNRLQTEEVPAIELERAKRSLVGALAMRLESPEQVLASTLDLVQNGLGLDYWDTYPNRIAAVTAQDVMRVAKKYLSPNRIQLMVVGEKSSILSGLQKYGTVKQIDPNHITVD